jgi:hypothetical protein
LFLPTTTQEATVNKIQIKVIKDEEDGDTVFEVKANALLATNTTTLPQAFELAKEWIEAGALGFFQSTDHIKADKDHRAEPDEVEGAFGPYNCNRCGLAVTSDGLHHGFDTDQ